MCKLFNEWQDQIRHYCDKNDLNFSKAEKMCKCWGKNNLFLQYHNPEKGKNGLLDETPAPVVLSIREVDGDLIFEQTEYTKTYLS